MSRIGGILGLAAALAASSCDQEPTVSWTPLEVVAVYPRADGHAGTVDDPQPLFLDSEIVVTFSEEIDRHSVTDNTIRVVKLTPSGPQRVRLSDPRVAGGTVRLVAAWPTNASLSNGSFQVGETYRLEIAGMRSLDTVESKSGKGVGRPYRCYFRVPEPAPDRPGPMLGPSPTEPFRLAGRSLRLAADSRTLRLQFSLAVDPRGVAKESFAFHYGSRIVPIESVRVVSLPGYVEIPPEGVGGVPRVRRLQQGSTIEVGLPASLDLGSGERFGVDLKPAGREAFWVRDYRGRTLPERFATGWISPGRLVELVSMDGTGIRIGAGPVTREAMVLTRRSPQELSFAGVGERIQVLARKQAGTGRLGDFRPVRDVELRPGVPFDPGNGRLVLSGSRFEFSEILIPVGVRVVLRSDAPVELLANGQIRIEGELVLETPHAASPAEFETMGDSRYLARVLRDRFGCRIVAAGNVSLGPRGRISHASTADHQPSPLVVLCQRLIVQGSLPSRTILAYSEPVVGSVQGVFHVPTRADRSLQSGQSAPAAAYTPWVRLPSDFEGDIDVRIERNHDVEVFLQLASSDPIDPTQPFLDPAGLKEPRRLPVQQPIRISRGMHARFLLRATVLGGQPLPSVRRLVILGDS